MRSCVPSWMTFSSQACRAGPQKRTPLWERNFGPTQGIHLHHGKTKVWNRGGVEPENIARLVRPDAVVWRGDPELPRNQQGLRVLGVPIGQPEFVRDFLEKKTREQAILFQRIPWVQDTQATFLLLLMCGSTRANFWLRSRHDTAVWGCLRAILGTPSADEAQVLATLALSGGGLGLSSAQGGQESPISQVGQTHCAPETPPHCGDHDSASGGGNCSMFPSGPGVQRIGGRGRLGSAILPG